MRHRCSGVYQNNTFLNRGNGTVSLVRCNRSRVGEKFNLVLAGRPKNIDSFYHNIFIPPWSCCVVFRLRWDRPVICLWRRQVSKRHVVVRARMIVAMWLWMVVGVEERLWASAPCANHVRKTAMLVVYPARSRATCAAQSEGRRKLFLGRLHPRMMMGSQSSGELKRSVSVCKGDSLWWHGSPW